jgi:glycerol kinase
MELYEALMEQSPTPAILAIDQGTARTKALIFDKQANCLAEAASEISLTCPQPGWVEQGPRDLLKSVVENARAALAATQARIVACGLANQGETVLIWRRRALWPRRVTCWPGPLMRGCSGIW